MNHKQQSMCVWLLCHFW